MAAKKPSKKLPQDYHFQSVGIIGAGAWGTAHGLGVTR